MTISVSGVVDGIADEARRLALAYQIIHRPRDVFGIGPLGDG